MPTLHFYLLRQVLTVLGASLGVFVAVLLLGNALKPVQTMLVDQQVSLATVLKVLALQLPWLLSFALPLALLSAVLLVFGRLSADQELTAIRSGGVSLSGFAWPVLMLGLVFSAVSAWVNLDVAPRCRIASKLEIGRMVSNPVELLAPDRYVRDFPGWTIYLTEKDEGRLKGLLLYRYDERGKLIQRLEAGRGEVRVDEAAGTMEFILGDVRLYWRNESGTGESSKEEAELSSNWETMTSEEHRELIRFDPARARMVKPKLSEMSHAQLREELKRVRREGLDDTPVKFHLHRQVASSFAGFGFVLLGIPLGIRAHRRETSVGLALALVVALAYYAFQAFAQALETKAGAQPHLLIWLPNFLFIGLGAWLFHRANAGIGD